MFSAGLRLIESTVSLPASVSQPIRRPFSGNPPIPPSDLKERYFLDVPTETRKMEWLQPPIASSSSDTSVRFDLSGTALSENAKIDLPSNLGLHHHGTSPGLAGYTLEDVIYLCRSAVSSQRIAMLGVLAKLIARYAYKKGGDLDAEAKKACEVEKVRDRGIDLSVEVLLSKSKSLGIVRAGIELLFEALGGSSWSWMDETDPSLSLLGDQPPGEGETSGLEALPFDDLMPRIAELLGLSSELPPKSIQQLILILRRAARHSQDLAETICPLIPATIRHHVLRQSWPLETSREPSVDALRLLHDAITSSRVCALSLAAEDLHHSLLKFVIPSTWTSAPESHDLALEVLRIYFALGRYGLCASLAASAQEIWRELSSWVSRQGTPGAVAAAYFDCLTFWTVCAIDPHRTTPEHDLIWAQVSAMGWPEEAIEIVAMLAGESGVEEVLASAVGLLVAWIDGASVNGVRNGEVEKDAVLDGIRATGLNELVARHIKEDVGEELSSETVHFLTAVVRLHARLSSSQPRARTLIQSDLLVALIRRLLTGDHLPSTGPSTVPLRYESLRLARCMDIFRPVEWSKTAFALMLGCGPGDETLALDLVDDIMRADWTTAAPGLADQLSSLTHRDGLQILRPLLHYAILPDVAQILGPSVPSHLYLKATSTLRPPTKTRSPGLPLSTDWTSSPLNELLSSAISPALTQAPPDWDASELDIVRATLILAQLCPCPVSRSKTLLNSMKVFMLEHGQQSSSTSETDIFRDPSISTALTTLLTPLKKPTEQPTPPSLSLEEVAKSFLGEDVPFFQFYTDFLALYEAISFSHPLFAQLLLPPLAMTYPVDYRKLLWAEQPTALRSIRTKMADVPLEHGSITVYFEPRETDADVLAGYTRALVRGWVSERTTEFLHRIAVHHLASLVWEGDEERRDSPRVSLLVALLSSANNTVLQRILEYDSSRPGELCAIGDEERYRRLAIVGNLAGSKGSRRLASL